MLKIVLGFGCLTTLSVLACSSLPLKSAHLNEPRVSIMTYNVENLFDTTHDEGKDDYTFLPLKLKKTHPEYLAACKKNQSPYRQKECLETDWSDEILETKLTRLAESIGQINNGQGPDIQILEEVENLHVLNMLADHLPAAAYTTRVLIEGPDFRGIDPAVLSRLPQWGTAEYHLIPFDPREEDEERAEHTRGILEVKLILPGGQRIAVFAVHLPAQENPPYLRKQAIRYLNELQSQVAADVIPIVGGDFNISADEDNRLGYYQNILRKKWLITHEIGCKNCEGTEYYRGSWSFFDALLFPPSMQEGLVGRASWRIDTASIRIPNDRLIQVSRSLTPAHFDETSPTGVSDHYPMYAEIYQPILSGKAP